MLNGDMSQSKRMFTLKSFKEGIIRVLVTTDVAARGLNMDNVGLVINFDVPKETESYIHRIGRTGRAWAFGKAIMLVSPEEQKFLADIEKSNKTRVKKSDHLTVSDKWQYATVRLNKSTDKTGKAAKKNFLLWWKTSYARPKGTNRAEDKKYGNKRPEPSSFVRGKESKFEDKRFDKPFEKKNYWWNNPRREEPGKFEWRKFGNSRPPQRWTNKHMGFKGMWR